MSVSNPLIASFDIAHTLPKKGTLLPKKLPLKPELSSFTTDMVTISRLGLEKQQKEIFIESSRKIEDIANEVIRVSSTIGKVKVVENLTHTQATNLYNKIASLL